MRHTTADFEGMRKAGHLAASTLDKLVDKVKPEYPQPNLMISLLTSSIKKVG